MSAHQCSPAHIAQLAALATETWEAGFPGVFQATPEATFKLLWDENARSVAYLYKEKPEAAPSMPRLASSANPIAWRRDPAFVAKVLKAVHAYEYQSCEHPEWPTSRAYEICDAMKKAAIRLLPGYEDAEWGAPF